MNMYSIHALSKKHKKKKKEEEKKYRSKYNYSKIKSV